MKGRRVTVPSHEKVDKAYDWMYDMPMCTGESTTSEERMLIAVMLKIGRDALRGMEGAVVPVPNVIINFEDYPPEVIKNFGEKKE